MCPRCSTTSWNKEQWKKLTEQSEWQYRKYCTSNAKKALVQNLVGSDFLFSMIFLIFFSAQGTLEYESHQVSPKTESRCGLQKIKQVCRKACWIETEFFNYLPDFF